MIIHWHQNPFFTKIELDESDKHHLLVAYQADRYTNILCEIDLWLQGRIRSEETPTTEKIHEKIKAWGEICNMKTDHEDIKDLIDDLDSEHFGDCTCVACSCCRCNAESLLGIDTIAGLSKHSAYKVRDAFGKDGTRSIDEAIEHLLKRPSYIKPDSWKSYTQEDYNQHVPRWENEREAALQWLKDYKNEHSF